ncbi:DUF2780 domain-containing protein [Vibrio sp. JC009]|uniref:DUF2780 domain-containing protein n=1 Tax=Vibrio sp. JC009 TaxID=2912314 RepID=UPI0023B1445D|nr:DUF2780 domain-containing protein [Vibrio sp. JC009]WED22115.1 DUF2780 domain-containing protein [Vibrio sp. JC009]
MKMMKYSMLLGALVVSMPSYALFNLGGSSDKAPAIDTGAITGLVENFTGQVQAQPDSPIVSALTSQFSDVSPVQATGGAGALLALASNSLSGSQSSELTSLIPGMSSLQNSTPGLMSTATDLSAVGNIFSNLGLSSSMVSQFAPVILQYLTGQGASAGLLGSLSSLWGV